MLAFSEAYLSEVSAALRTLVREGPNHEALKHSDRLYEIKRQYVLWLTPDLEKRLEPFERALRKIGAAGTVSRKVPNSENSQKWHAEMFQSFAEVLGTEHMGKEWDGKAISDEAAIGMVVSHLRSIGPALPARPPRGFKEPPHSGVALSAPPGPALPARPPRGYERSGKAAFAHESPRAALVGPDGAGRRNLDRVAARGCGP